MKPISVWIDARGPTSATGVSNVFGMSLVERLVRAVLEAGVRPRRVEISAPDAARDSELDNRLGQALGRGVLAWRSPEMPPPSGSSRWLVLDGTSLVDPRLLAHLASADRPSVAWGDDADPAFAATVEGALEDVVGAPTSSLHEPLRDLEARGRLARVDRGVLPRYLPRLRRELTPYCLRVGDGEARDRAERTLFWGNYKGSTDFFTKHVYPPLVWTLVRPLARWRVHPNWISVFNVVITVAAVPLFAVGAWVPGLVLAYTMSVLDSVDGKLARLTFRSSKLGHVLDHGLDVIHPPFWYAAWAWALDGGVAGFWFATSVGLAIAYFADRIVTELFTRGTGRSIHAYAPIDVRMRTWISRRNINVPLFTLGLLAGVPKIAFGLVLAWQGLTLLFHATRLVQVTLALRRADPGSHTGAPTA